MLMSVSEIAATQHTHDAIIQILHVRIRWPKMENEITKTKMENILIVARC